MDIRGALFCGLHTTHKQVLHETMFDTPTE